MSSFFSPRGYKILSSYGDDKNLWAVVRIDSSNRRGSQITATWYFSLNNVSGKWCVNVIWEKK